LSKEEKNTRINLYKINYQWRTLMRDIKSRDLKRDIEILSQTFERIIDRKDSVIKAMVKDLGEAEEQYSMALRSHIKNVDDIIDLQTEQLETARDKYEYEIEIVKNEFDKERVYIETKYEREMNELQTIIFGMEKLFLDQENDALAEFHNLKDEIKNKVYELQNLRTKFNSLINIF
jgi:dynein regulatory complex subunit 2